MRAGDGIDDLIVGAPRAGPDGAGESYVIFGTVADFAANVDLAALDGSNGFRLDGIDAYDFSGYSVAGAGDVNGDGIDDLIVGAPGIYTDGLASASYVVFGTDTGFAASFDLSDLDGSNGFRIDGAAYSSTGHSVEGAGDVNGDGIDDLIVGALDYFGEGPSYVVFGSSAGLAASIDLSALDGTDGFRLDRGAWSVAGAGDVNGDGIDDLIVGAFTRDNYAAGESYVVFGTDAGFAANLDLSTLDGSNGFRLDGFAGYDILSVAGAGDVNGDGIDDLIVGAFAADESYVVFGTDAGFAASLDLATLDGSNGFRLDAVNADDWSGYSVAGAGDFNGDGIDDLVIGAPRAAPGDKDSAGESYVVFGTSAGFAASLDLASLDGTNGFRLEGIGAEDGSGSSVAGAGDVNGDGFDDLVVGARGADDDAGESYVVFGFSTGSQTPIFGGPGRDVLAGTDASESFHPGGGYDFVTTGGGTDTIFFDDLAGQRDVLTVADLDPLADALDLRGAAVAETLESETRTVLLLDGPDRDTIVLLGLSDPPLDLI
jgi:hypothetical protein